MRDLLLASARVSMGSNEPQTITQLLTSPDMDWDELIRLAYEHGTLPLLNRVFGRNLPPTVPPGFVMKLRDLAQGNARRNLFLLQCLLDLMGKMHGFGVRALPYKGPLLAMTAYGDPSLKQSSDLEIIVPEGDLPAAIAVLEAAGFREFETPEVTDPGSDEVIERCQLTYKNHDHSIVVQLHWQIVGLFSVRLDPVDLWHRARTRPVAGVQIPMLSAEDELLVLCMHGTRNYWTRMTTICDIAQCLKNNRSIDWDLVLHRAVEEDAQGMVVLAMLLVNETLATPVPKAIRAASKAVHHAAARDLAARLFCDHSADFAAAREASVHAWPNRLAPSHLIPRFVHYMTRPWRALAKYGQWSQPVEM